MPRRLAAMILGVLAHVAQGAEVSKINTKKGEVLISEGGDQGFVKGAKVCFFDAAEKKRGCARVIRSKPDRAIVKIKNPKFLKIIRPGMIVQPDSSTPLPGGEPDPPPPGGFHRTNFKLLYLPGLTAIQSQRIAYYDRTSDDTTSWWISEGRNGYTALGSIEPVAVGAELEFGIGSSFSLAVGGRFRYQSAYGSISNLSLTQELPLYVATNISGMSFGGWSDFYFLDLLGPTFLIRFGAGLDFEWSSVDLVATLHSDDDPDLAEDFAKSSSSVMGLGFRLPISVNLFFESFGLLVSAVPIVPLVAFGQSFSATFGGEFPEAEDDVDPSNDLKTALGHGKGTWGVEAVVGAYIPF